MRVGSLRIPYSHCSPDCWGTPHLGTLLAQDDPIVWKDSMQFGSGVPGQLEVSEHVRRCHEQGWLRDEVPVLWDFGKVYWSDVGAIHSAEADLAAFAFMRTWLQANPRRGFYEAVAAWRAR